jgi:hypothetical protein
MQACARRKPAPICVGTFTKEQRDDTQGSRWGHLGVPKMAFGSDNCQTIARGRPRGSALCGLARAAVRFDTKHLGPRICRRHGQCAAALRVIYESFDDSVLFRAADAVRVIRAPGGPR